MCWHPVYVEICSECCLHISFISLHSVLVGMGHLLEFIHFSIPFHCIPLQNHGSVLEKVNHVCIWLFVLLCCFHSTILPFSLSVNLSLIFIYFFNTQSVDLGASMWGLHKSKCLSTALFPCIPNNRCESWPLGRGQTHFFALEMLPTWMFISSSPSYITLDYYVTLDPSSFLHLSYISCFQLYLVKLYCVKQALN